VNDTRRTSRLAIAWHWLPPPCQDICYIEGVKEGRNGLLMGVAWSSSDRAADTEAGPPTPQADLKGRLYEPFSIPLALRVGATFGPDRQAITDFPASTFAACAPIAAANET
jgi:hypothetical protein